MSPKPIKIPGPDHPISIEANPAHVVVLLNGQVIAESDHALTLREANYPPVTYIPREDVSMSLLSPSDHATYCPYKGDASYYSLPLGGRRSDNAIWSYLHPHAAVSRIAGHMAFYPDRVDSIEARDL